MGCRCLVNDAHPENPAAKLSWNRLLTTWRLGPVLRKIARDGLSPKIHGELGPVALKSRGLLNIAAGVIAPGMCVHTERSIKASAVL